MHALIKFARRILPQRLKSVLKLEIMQHFSVPSMEWSLRNMCRLGFKPEAVVDIGAHEGAWTAMAREIFPDASFLLLEAQERQKPQLEALAQKLGHGVNVRIALLGAEPREAVVLHQYDHAVTAASVLADHCSSHSRTVTSPMQTLDKILAETKLPEAGLLKLDVQGYELEVLKGGENTLKRSEVVLLEVSLIDLYQDNPLLHDVAAFMAARNFRAYDICSLVRRPLDGALCQLDMIFVKGTSALWSSSQWI